MKHFINICGVVVYSVSLFSMEADQTPTTDVGSFAYIVPHSAQEAKLLGFCSTYPLVKNAAIPIKMMGNKIDDKILNRALEKCFDAVQHELASAINPHLVSDKNPPYYSLCVPVCLIIRSKFERKYIKTDPLTKAFFNQLAHRFIGSDYIDKCTRTLQINIDHLQEEVDAISIFYNKHEIMKIINEYAAHNS